MHLVCPLWGEGEASPAVGVHVGAEAGALLGGGGLRVSGAERGRELEGEISPEAGTRATGWEYGGSQGQRGLQVREGTERQAEARGRDLGSAGLGHPEAPGSETRGVGSREGGVHFITPHPHLGQGPQRLLVAPANGPSAFG